MNLKKKVLNFIPVIATVGSALAVVSCGSDKKPVTVKGASTSNSVNSPFANSNPFSFKNTGSESGESSGAGLADIVSSKLADDALHRPAGWSMGRNDDMQKSAGEAGAIKSRKDTGVPLHPGFTWHDLWNWNPISNIDGSLTGNPEVERKIDYKSFNGRKPVIDNIWGLVDKKFLRASVRTPQAREFGEQMLTSQSTIAPYWDTRTYNSIGAPTGFAKGVNNGMQWTFQNSFTYQQAHVQWTHSSEWSIWEAMWPSADYIDLAHRNGVPVLGLGWMMGGYTRPEILAAITSPGPNKDYPIAKGMAELANYIGFDGWWIDWEAEPMDRPGFNKALMSYCKIDQYTTADGKVVKLSEENAAARKLFNYGPREQIIAQYSGDPGKFANLGDHYFSYQNHGGSKARSNPLSKYDAFWSGSASNADEDGMTQSLAHHWDYYAGQSTYQGASHPANQTLSASDLTRRMDYAMWFHNWTSDDVQNCMDMYNTYTRDPRIAPQTKDRLSIGNLFRERTPIVGRKSFASNFGIGKGSHLSLWGSNDLLDYTQGVGTDGWKHQGMADVLPTYNWVIDYYNQANQKTNDIAHPQYTSDGRVQRPTNLVYNFNADKAWFGGTTLDITGDLAQGNKMETKLYASRVDLKAGDKVSFKVKNSWKNEADRILPELALWTTDQNVATQDFYASNGSTETIAHEGTYALGWDRSSGANKWDKMPELLKYQKAGIDAVTEDQKTKTIIGSDQATVTKVNDNWLNVEYTIPANLENKTMIDFGFSATSKGAGTITKLSLGQIAYTPKDEQETSISAISNIKTDGVWRANNVTRARISWDTMKNDTEQIESDKIRHYLVFYLNDNGERESLSWVGGNPTAYLDLIDRTKDVQNIEIVAVDNKYQAIFSQKVAVQLAAQE